MATKHIHIHVGGKKTKDVAINGQRFVSNANAFIKEVNNTKIDFVPTEATPRQAQSISQSIVDLNILIGAAKRAIAELKRIEND